MIVYPSDDLAFQLTPSRRATIRTLCTIPPSIISTHALTEGDMPRTSVFCNGYISTHALTEGDLPSLSTDCQ